MINEINVTLTAFTADPDRGALTEIQPLSTLPEGVGLQEGFSTAEVQVHPSGKFLYGSNRGHNSITVFALDQSTGRLTFVQNEPTQGNGPRGFGIDPTGGYFFAANQRSDTVVIFRIVSSAPMLTDRPAARRRLQHSSAQPTHPVRRHRRAFAAWIGLAVSLG